MGVWALRWGRMLRGRHYQFEQPATQRALLNVMKFTMVPMEDVNSIGTVATQQAPSEQPASTHKHLAITLGCSNGNGVIYMAWVIFATVLWIPGFQRGKEGPSAPASPSSNQQRPSRSTRHHQVPILDAQRAVGIPFCLITKPTFRKELLNLSLH